MRGVARLACKYMRANENGGLVWRTCHLTNQCFAKTMLRAVATGSNINVNICKILISKLDLNYLDVWNVLIDESFFIKSYSVLLFSALWVVLKFICLNGWGLFCRNHGSIRANENRRIVWLTFLRTNQCVLFFCLAVVECRSEYCTMASWPFWFSGLFFA